MTTRKKRTTPTKTPEIVSPIEPVVTPATELSEAEVAKIPESKKKVDFEDVRAILTKVGLKSGETANDALSLIAIKFYQRMNKLPISGKLDDKTLEKMGL